MATAKKGGLGKGLDSLIVNKNAATKPAAEKKDEKAVDGILVNINKVEPNREQPRKNFDEDALLELSESIKQFGVLQPLLVQDKKDYYEIIVACIEENLRPFLKSLISTWKTHSDLTEYVQKLSIM